MRILALTSRIGFNMKKLHTPSNKQRHNPLIPPLACQLMIQGTYNPSIYYDHHHLSCRRICTIYLFHCSPFM